MPTLAEKPEKPSPDFPLFPHNAGVWAKKINQRMYYFGPWSDPQGALKKYLSEVDDLQAGRRPRMKGNGLTVRELVNQYMNAKKDQFEAGEIAARTYGDCYKVCERIVSAFGPARLVSDLAADDFRGFRRTLAKRLGPLALGIEIQRIRSVFKFGLDDGLIKQPVNYGRGFEKPSRKVLLTERQRRGPKMFTAEELHRIIDAAPVPLKAMIMLGLNAGMGNRDVAMMPLVAVDLDKRMLDFPRPKTAQPRRAVLWKETVQALRDAIEARPEPKNDADAHLLFLTRQGLCWVEQSNGERKAWKDSVGLAFGKLLRTLGLKREGVNFYSLRHVYRTVADAIGDRPAIDLTMGHAPDGNDMRAVYCEAIDDERLRIVANHVHAWLYPSKKRAKPAQKG